MVSPGSIKRREQVRGQVPAPPGIRWPTPPPRRHKRPVVEALVDSVRRMARQQKGEQIRDQQRLSAGQIVFGGQLEDGVERQVLQPGGLIEPGRRR